MRNPIRFILFLTVLVFDLSGIGGRVAYGGVPVCDFITSEVKTVYFGIEVPTPDPDHPVTVWSGHTDVDVPYIDCVWRLEISPDSGQIDPEDALIFAGTSARFNLPSIPPGFEFIGALPGQTFWVIPQNNTPGVVFLGVSTESMTTADRNRVCIWNPGDPRGGANVPAKWIRIELADVRGPKDGYFSMWQTSGPGAVTAYVSTFDGGITEDDAFHLVSGSHSHMNWGFTQPGLYEVDFWLSTYVERMHGDLACDCIVDLSDVPAFVEALLSPESYTANYPDCNIWNADVNEDGEIDGADIQWFVNLLL